jgi:hypothetical protein
MNFPDPPVIMGISMSGLVVSIDANVCRIVVASGLEESSGGRGGWPYPEGGAGG